MRAEKCSDTKKNVENTLYVKGKHLPHTLPACKIGNIDGMKVTVRGVGLGHQRVVMKLPEWTLDNPRKVLLRRASKWTVLTLADSQRCVFNAITRVISATQQRLLTDRVAGVSGSCRDEKSLKNRGMKL